MPGNFHPCRSAILLAAWWLLACPHPLVAQADAPATTGSASHPLFVKAKDTSLDTASRLVAVRELSSAAPPGCRAVLQSLVADPSEDIAVEALRGLGELDPVRALAECRRVITDDAAPLRLRQQGIQWLGSAGHPDATQLIRALLGQAATGGLDARLRADLIAAATAINDPALAADIAMATGSAQPVPATAADHPGKRVYANACAACHADTGLGLPGVYPPLKGTPWLDLDPGVLIRMQLHGLDGPITVNGVDYNAAMPPNAETLTDQDVADVLNYVRASWGKPGLPAVDAAMVASERQQHIDRDTPWTIAELGQPPTTPAEPTAAPAHVLPAPARHSPRLGAHVVFLLPMLGFLAGCLCLREP